VSLQSFIIDLSALFTSLDIDDRMRVYLDMHQKVFMRCLAGCREDKKWPRFDLVGLAKRQLE
jgi:hypothetical protein